MLVDTHAHLQWGSFDKDREEVVDRARKVDVRFILNIGFDTNGSIEAIELAERHKGLYASVGIHPHNASQFTENTLDTLRKLSENPKVIAIGEIGLDYYRELSSRKAQRKAFEAQLLLAQELDLPVIIHDREAHNDTLDTLSRFKREIRGIMHCFSGSREMAEQCIEYGFFISFAGPVTFPNARKLREITKRTDLNKILLETDSPWLAPQDMRGERNEPAFLIFIAKEIAKIKRIPISELAEATTENTKKILQLP